jgi:hypothetical protein
MPTVEQHFSVRNAVLLIMETTSLKKSMLRREITGGVQNCERARNMVAIAKNGLPVVN